MEETERHENEYSSVVLECRRKLQRQRREIKRCACERNRVVGMSVIKECFGLGRFHYLSIICHIFFHLLLIQHLLLCIFQIITGYSLTFNSTLNK